MPEISSFRWSKWSSLALFAILYSLTILLNIPTFQYIKEVSDNKELENSQIFLLLKKFSFYFRNAVKLIQPCLSNGILKTQCLQFYNYPTVNVVSHTFPQCCQTSVDIVVKTIVCSTWKIGKFDDCNSRNAILNLFLHVTDNSFQQQRQSKCDNIVEKLVEALFSTLRPYELYCKYEVHGNGLPFIYNTLAIPHSTLRKL